MKRMARIQQTLASQTSFEKHGRKSKRELFLDHMEQVVPWSELLALFEPHYPKAGNGRQPVGVAIMLRTYFLQQWFSLSDPGMEEAFYESPVLRRFAGVDLGVAAAPDETTILRFRHLLEQHDLGGQMLDTVNHYLESKGIRISTGTIVDATIIHAPSSTKNSTGERDPEICIRPRRATSDTSEPRRTSAWTAGRRSCVRCVLRRPAWRTNICCPTYCTAKSTKYGAMAPIRALYDLLTELAQRHSGARHVRILFDQTEDVAVRRVAVEAQQQVRRGEMEKAQRVALHELRAVDQLAQFYRRGRRGHGHDRVARFGRRQQMAHRADAADARRDRRHLVIGPAFGEFFETAHLGHMKVRVGDMARIIQVDIDLGVPFDARDGVDDKFSHGVAPTRISPLMPGPACGPLSVLPARRRSQPATEDSRGYAGPP